MKIHLCSFAGWFLASLLITASRAEAKDYDDAHRFVFYAVLEGCYEDGLSSNDVAQILMRREGESYYHFVYACPLCTPALHAFDVYRHQGPFANMKNPTPTFGPGLEPELTKELYSEKVEDRLAAINTLVQRWVTRRMTQLRLTTEEQDQLQQALERKRKEGMKMLGTFVQNNTASKMAPAYGAKDECAICNAAVGMALPRPDPKSTNRK